MLHYRRAGIGQYAINLLRAMSRLAEVGPESRIGVLQMRADTEPIVADRPGNHGPGNGGNVLLKSGALQTCTERDPLWAQAARSTSD